MGKRDVLDEMLFDAAALYRPDVADIKPRFGMRKYNESGIHWLELGILAMLLDSGDGKDILFATVRKNVDRVKPEAVIFCADAWFSKLDDAALKKAGLTTEDLHRMSTADLVERGLATRSEVLIYTAQNSEEVIIVQTPYQRLKNGLLKFGESERLEFPQAQFDGRQKMFGDSASDHCWNKRL